MKAVTIRDTSGTLLCFGPADTGYDPSIPVGAIKTIEDDYNAVYTEYVSLHAQDHVQISLEDRIIALETRLSRLERP